jgi:hypothetical protein
MMKTYDGRWLIAISGIVCAIVVGLVLRTRFAETSVSANEKISITSTNLSETLSDQTAQPQNDNYPADIPTEMSHSINGVTFTILEFTEWQQYIDIQVCFTIPYGFDWTVHQANLTIDGIDYPLEGSALIELVRFPTDGQQMITRREEGNFKTTYLSEAEAQTPRRCDHLLFDQPPSPFNSAKLKIESIISPPSEGGVCDPSYLEKVQQVLDARQTGITIDCFIHQDNNTSGGISGLIVSNKPESMSEEEAYAILNSNEVQLEVNGVQGPWLFDLVPDW